MDRDFTEIYREYRDMVYNYMYWKTGSSEEALDLTQEVFLKIYKNLRKFRGESSLKTWIMKIATNHAN
ncbi:MAG: RNA polymerase sigma factor, partial [Candidatus Hydrothermota bacterium]